MAVVNAPKELTVSLLVAYSSRKTFRAGLTEEERRASLLCSSHLRLNGRGIGRLSHLDMCPNARVLYAFDNLIEDLSPACDAKLLESIYAQNNLISSVPANLGAMLPNLTRLYLNGNMISMFTGWSGVGSPALEELHLADQRGSADGIAFDSDTLVSLSKSLKVLDISGNKLQSLSFLTGLNSLETLLADSNDLSDTEDLITFLSSNPSLKMVSFKENAVSLASSAFRDAVVLVCPHLEFFNGKSVSSSEREFVKRKAVHNTALQSLIGNVTY